MISELITEQMVRDGISSGTVEFVTDPNMGFGTVCKIGDFWFYFGGIEAESMEPKEYLKVTPIDDIIREIMDTLQSFIEDEESNDEYNYYLSILA